ncbi:hypothetical protein ONS95_005941 [Cadophora gregata]|uniref:uncharacterized protein n=1 Tax=Cadophora gregata TaxID=51156 RepID=UPI0026DC8A86|nr:uncharacterized protein ONS95_005941 [Cadophora gregata]KAK0102318.1 hypothetical protein ONS95_005941 [Cadophora gregata]
MQSAREAPRYGLASKEEGRRFWFNWERFGSPSMFNNTHLPKLPSLSALYSQRVPNTLLQRLSFSGQALPFRPPQVSKLQKTWKAQVTDAINATAAAEKKRLAAETVSF